jgi:hypothetical protein
VAGLFLMGLLLAVVSCEELEQKTVRPVSRYFRHEQGAVERAWPVTVPKDGGQILDVK